MWRRQARWNRRRSVCWSFGKSSLPRASAVEELQTSVPHCHCQQVCNACCASQTGRLRQAGRDLHNGSPRVHQQGEAEALVSGRGRPGQGMRQTPSPPDPAVSSVCAGPRMPVANLSTSAAPCTRPNTGGMRPRPLLLLDNFLSNQRL